ncbi:MULTISPECIES: DUF956 family protein [unclassified Lactobacillus]|uniref:DUF956 family protein n=1 Tax=unclassified Lactobacillus TaxID=2620435 RepID=UPI000EFCD5BE|nr:MULTISPECIES: DUF956 family protein [unclassified Lactobacillus]RMC41315.1 DUF956 family protein [Lactobacillus sp. ESL0237]RMC45184.1 DUF956 family protein [Lactobacillus sp. ESL0234]RMC46017.1 DUF956 family protein [Lactobacillus sp. ESL0236]RMC47104.1 DUF956 family protein [Lactobacillus sp. ESL0230]RMC51699.1 DUF956 family protein [Lactobacillus sp. ESL0225]
MVESSNNKVDFTTSATWFRGISTYGKAMIGNKAFEFYNDRNISDYVQIPWAEVTYIVADVHFGGRYIPRFEIRTKVNGKFIFSTRNNKKTLRAIRNYVPADRMRQALGLWQKIKQRLIHN